MVIGAANEAMRSYLANEAQIEESRSRYALAEGHVDEKASPWIPLYDNAAIRYLTFDVRSNSMANMFWIQHGGELGRHRHRGIVSGYTLEGTWRYLEYDWVAKAGDFVRESPGRTHTMYTDSGMKSLWWLTGPIEYLDHTDNVIRVRDVFWFIDHYERYCAARGIPINRDLFL